MILFLCPRCGQKLTVREDWVGKSCLCPRCRQTVPVKVPVAVVVASAAAGPLPQAVPLGMPGRPAQAAEAPTPGPSQLHDTTASTPAARSTGGEWPLVPGYEILDELGRGGMGVVYKARQLSLKRLVALKMILAGAHAAASQLARFRAEAEAVARLQHPNIVQIHEVGERDGLPFFSLEYVAGGTLAQKLASTPVPARDAAQLVDTLARTVQYAHDHGIIHRDLKPANILLDCRMPNADGRLEEGQQRVSSIENRKLAIGIPKITDFGLAKTVDSSDGQTRSGAVVGTPSYAAPEQAAGKKEIGPQADIYALGAILYEMLTGRPPFRGETPMDTLLQVLSEEPVPPSRLNPKVPRDLETICLKCLHKEAARRYPRALDLADDLVRFLNGWPIQARPAGPVERLWRWCRHYPAAAALLAVVSVLLAVVTLGAILGMWHLSRLSQDLVRSTAIESAAQESEMLESLNSFYSSRVVDRVKTQGVEVTHDYAARKGAIPLPATLTIELGNHISEESERGVQVRLYSDFPFRSRTDGGPKDDFEKQALLRLRQNPQEPFFRFEPVQGRPTLRYATARRMKESCIKCHNTHPESTKQDWKEGDVRGVVEIIRPLDRDVARTHEGLRGTFRLVALISGTLLLVLSAAVGAVAWFFVARTKDPFANTSPPPSQI